ncbi:hypothetical protein D6789_03730 [Candidatus Woesearchaeota archaeon]|nr:MAG: hypothetical protein D6789_03730 [Candidatus Woesearchaeota archaeon]
MTRRLAFIVLLCVFCSVPVVTATASIRMSEEDRTQVYIPGKVYEFNWLVTGSDHLTVELRSAFDDRAVLYDPDPGGGPRQIRFTISPPDDLEPGIYSTRIIVTEGSTEGFVGARAKVQTSVKLIVLSPKPLVKAGLNVRDTAEGEATRGELELRSWSEVPTANVYADIVVRNPNGEDITATTTPVTVAAGATTTAPFTLSTEDLPPGWHTASAVLHNTGEGGTETTSKEFRIGSLTMNLISYTQRLSAGSINRFTFTIGSNWNQQLEDVSGIVELAGASERTASIKIKPFGEAKLTAYLDLSDVAVNGSEDYNGTIKVIARDGYEDRDISTFNIKVSVMEEQLPTTDISPEELQEPKTYNIVIPLNLMTILYLIALLLIIINVVLLLRKRR